jgi:hypothetical protein
VADIELLDKVIEHIKAYPALWDQSGWAVATACGTTHCVAGWAVHLTYPDAVPGLRDLTEDSEMFVFDGATKRYDSAAMRLLGLDATQAGSLFAAGNSLPDIEKMRDSLANDPNADLYPLRADAEVW